MDDHRMDAARYIMSGVFAEMGCAVDWTERTIRPAPERGKEMPRPVTIQFVLNGFEVTVGCQTLVFNSVESLLRELDNYLRTPALAEERYMKDALNSENMFPEEERVELPRGTDGPEPVDCDAAGMPRPAEPPPVWEQIVGRLDDLDATQNAEILRLGRYETDVARLLDTHRARFDRVDEGLRISAENDDQLSDRITELEGVLDEVGLRVSRLDGEPRGD